MALDTWGTSTLVPSVEANGVELVWAKGQIILYSATQQRLTYN
ncbi:hypothetical protein [Gloeocapsa sp. PCC 7428]